MMEVDLDEVDSGLLFCENARKISPHLIELVTLVGACRRVFVCCACYLVNVLSRVYISSL